MALRFPVAADDFPEWVTVVRGFRLALALLTYRPVLALLDAIVWLLPALAGDQVEAPQAV